MVSPVPTPRSKTIIIGHPLSNSQRRTTVSTGYPVFYTPPPTIATTTAANTATTITSQSSSFFFRLFAISSTVLLLLSVLALLLLLIVHPRLPNIRVSSATSIDDSASNSTRLSVVLHFVNPNPKLSLHYDNIDVFLRYGIRGDLASVRLPPIKQTKLEATRVHAQLLLSGGIGGIGDERKGENGTGVRFGVAVFASVRFGLGIFRSRDRGFSAMCYPVNVVFDRNNSGIGAMVGPSIWCKD